MAGLPAALALVPLLWAAGCREVTQLYFHIAGDLRVPADLDQLTLVLARDEARFQTAHRLQGPPRDLDETLAILAGREIVDDVLVEVRALRADQVIAETALAARFCPDERVEVEVWLDPLSVTGGQGAGSAWSEAAGGPGAMP